MKDAGQKARVSTVKVGKQAEREGKFKPCEQANLTYKNKGAIAVGLFGSTEPVKRERNSLVC